MIVSTTRRASLAVPDTGTRVGASALAVTGIPAFKEPFGPLMPGVRHIPNTLGESGPEGGSAADLPSIRALDWLANLGA